MNTKFLDLKIVSISHFISRSGTLFVHSLLDNHPEIISIPGTIDIVDLLKAKNLSAEENFQIFEKNNPKFFDTSTFNLTDKNSSMLWFLGENKNDKIVTDKNVFKEKFLEFLKDKDISPRNTIIALYYSYAFCHKKDMSLAKILLLHPHEKKTTLIFNKFFNDSIYLIPLRNPLRAYESIIKKVRAVTKLRGKEYYPSGQLVESALDIKDFYSLNMKMYFIKIENLSKNLEYEMKKLAKFLKINFNDSMLQSTFGGYKYWSNNVDKRSNKFDISRHNYSVNLPRKDLIILNSINKQFLDILNYEKITLTNIEKIFLPIFFLLPMDDEIDFIKKINLKNIFTYLKFLVFFFPKRIYLLFLLLSNKFSSRYKYMKKEMS